MFVKREGALVNTGAPSVHPNRPPPGASGPSDVPLKDLQLEYSEVTCVKSSGDNGDTPLTASAYVLRRAVFVYRVPSPPSPFVCRVGRIVSYPEKHVLRSIFDEREREREEATDFIRCKREKTLERSRVPRNVIARIHFSRSELIFLLYDIYNAY